MNVPALQRLFSAFDVASGHFRRYDRPSLRAELAGGGWELVDAALLGRHAGPAAGLRKMLLRAPTAETIRRGFGPPSRFAHASLRALMKAETAVLARPPVGASLLMVARRRSGG